MARGVTSQPTSESGSRIGMRRYGGRRRCARTSRLAPERSFSTRGCPVSLDLARQHVADLRRARLAETVSSCLSH
jgi:hypothetical protein